MFFLIVFGAIHAQADDAASNMAEAVATNQPMTLKAVTAKWQDVDPNTLSLAATNGDLSAQTYLGDQDILSDDSETQTQGVYWCGLAANKGFAIAEDLLGWAYGNGRGVDRDYELGEKWMHRAADQGLIAAEYDLGYLLENEFDKSGQQVGNFAEASEWYRKAADKGHVKAMFALAELYNYGKLGDDQRSKCIPWYLKAAALGNADAKAEVGELAKYYPDSPLLKKVDAVAAIQQAAESGNFEAQYQLAQRYQAGNGVPQDASEAFRWMQKAVHNGTGSSLAGDAMYQLGLMYEKGIGAPQDETQAHALFLQAADNYATPDATFRVGQMYEKGDGVPQDDRKAAEYYASEFHNSIDTNDPNIIHAERYSNGVINYATPSDASLENLLNLWANGRGLPPEADKRIPGYKEPAELLRYFAGYIKSAKAQFLAGEIYYQGNLVTKDMAQAADWYQKAATQGSPEAMNRIGEMWAAGINGVPDQVEADRWFQKAAELGSVEAEHNLGLASAQNKKAADQLQNQFLEKYDLNHNGIIDPDEKEAALADPDFIKSQLDVIDPSHLGWLDARALAYFDANNNKILDPTEQTGIEIAQHLLAERLFKQFDTKAEGKLDRTEFNALIESSVKTDGDRPFTNSSLFSRVDDNNDSYVDLGELESYLKLQTRKRLRSAGVPNAAILNQMRTDPNHQLASRQLFKAMVDYYWQHPTLSFSHSQAYGSSGFAPN